MKITLEKRTVTEFYQKWDSGFFRGMRLGQAFYDYFNLYKLSDQEGTRNLFNVTSNDEARAIIKELVELS